MRCSSEPTTTSSTHGRRARGSPTCSTSPESSGARPSSRDAESSAVLLSRLRHPGNQARFAIERRALRNPRVAQFHTDAPIVRDHLVRFYGIDVEKIRVVPPGINPEEFRPGDRDAARKLTGLPADERPLVLFCGHDFARKGLDRAIRATAASRLHFELVVVGRNGDQPAFERLAEACAVRDRVHFVGTAPNAFLFFQAADVFVLPTRADIWGVTVLEAMACGIPPIVSDAAGAATAVSHGVDGFILPEPVAPEQLAETLDRRTRRSRAPAERCHRAAARRRSATPGRRTAAASSRISRRSWRRERASRRLAVAPAGAGCRVSSSRPGRTRSGRCGAEA